MKHLVEVINKLQDVFNTVGGELMDLPQIVVVGAQSSGKSSVLESIVGFDVLPRGSGIVTRRPLVLQLVNSPGQASGRFLHIPDKDFTNLNQIRDEIQRVTNNDPNCQGRNVSNKPINLRIQSPYVPTLTLVDLPGLTKVAVEGQDPGIVEAIHTMVLEYITKPNALILAVTPANQDLANSDSLKIAREVDPEGVRTMGVITKIDLMDAGTDASDILNGRVYPLKLGYTGVVCRSQKDIDANLPMSAALKREHEFFMNSPIYQNLIDRCGIQVLSNKLTDMLVNHIRLTIPSLRTRVTQLILDKENELKKYGEDPANLGMNANEIILQIINQYVQCFNDLIEGKVGNQIDEEIKGGARINNIFTTKFEKEITECPSIQSTNINEIIYMMRNQSGITVPIYASHQAFESLVRRHIEHLRSPSLKTVSLVANEILNIHAQVTFPELEKYPQAKDAIRNVVEELVNSCVQPTIKFVNDVIDNEKIFINTARHDFRGAAVLAEKMHKEEYPKKKTRQQIQQEEAQTLVALCGRYFELIRVQIVDLVPKAIVMMLVEGSSATLQKVLVTKVFASGMLNEMMKEDPRIANARKKCQEILNALRQAQYILNELRKSG